MKLKKNKIKAIKELAMEKGYSFYRTALEQDKKLHFKHLANLVWLYSPGIDEIVLGSKLHDFANREYGRAAQGIGATFQDVSWLTSDTHQVRININNRYMSVKKLERLVTNVANAYASIARRVNADATQAKRLIG